MVISKFDIAAASLGRRDQESFRMKNRKVPLGGFERIMTISIAICTDDNLL